MSFTAIAAAAMMLYADAELPWWVPSAPWSFLPPAAQPIVPGLASISRKCPRTMAEQAATLLLPN
jgi:hypothetical protein